MSSDQNLGISPNTFHFCI